MSRLICSLSLLLACSMTVLAQGSKELAGIWLGKLNASGVSLRIIFNVTKKGENYTATMDSPDQGAKGIPCGTPTIVGDEVTIPVAIASGSFKGKLSTNGKRLEGIWTQRGGSVPLMLEKVDRIEEARRPQNPKGPFPYAAEDVTFTNAKAKIDLAGTLTLPEGKGPFPAVVLVSGSGAQDRDETILNHKPFWILADLLTRRGIAVLRYDDRGTAKSKGDFATATTDDFADDAQAAVTFLGQRKDIDRRRIGIMGHSEGGLIAPIVAARDRSVGFIVLMAGTGVPGDQVIELQSAMILKANGATEAEVLKAGIPLRKICAAIKEGGTRAETEARVDKLLEGFWADLTPEEKKPFKDFQAFKFQQGLASLMTPWFRRFLDLDPRESLRKVRVPVLVLNGTTDLQVIASQNVPEIEKALKAAGNRRVTVEVLDRLNHLFQYSKTGNPAEYSTNETTLDRSFLVAVTDWFDRVVLRKRDSN